MSRRTAPLPLAATLACMLLALSLAGCGFKLRGAAPLPFAQAYVEAGAATVSAAGIASGYTSQRTASQIGPLLRQNLTANGKLATGREAASVIIRLNEEGREKNILSLSGSGKVREYRLVQRVTLSAVDQDGKLILAPAIIQLNRDFSYSDEEIMAKEAEEVQLLREMEQDMLRLILRRLGYVSRP